MIGQAGKIAWRLGLLSAAIVWAAWGCGCSSTKAQAPPRLAQAMAERAYVYGYPLVLMEMTRRVSTNVKEPGPLRAPMNEFAHMTEFPAPTFTDVIRPNADTLYSLAWLDLSDEPMILQTPDTAGRYYVMQLLDAWTNVFASVGKRTTGTGEGSFAIVGPSWRGELPARVKPLRSPTQMVWIVGRTQADGKFDLGAVRSIQVQYRLTPLSAWRRERAVPRDRSKVDRRIKMRKSPVDQVDDLGAEEFFAILATLMTANPPAVSDRSTVDEFAAIGLVPGEAFTFDGMNPLVVAGIEQAVVDARDRIAKRSRELGSVVNGWRIMRRTGAYGTNYAQRAAVARMGLGANLPADAVYPFTPVDRDDRPLSGANRYRVRFEAGDTPPVHAFWSLTLYNERGFFTENPIDRYALGDRDALRYEADGSLEILISPEPPAEGDHLNWLPAPEAGFTLTLRLYWPKRAVLDGSWRPPTVTRLPVEGTAAVGG